MAIRSGVCLLIFVAIVLTAGCTQAPANLTLQTPANQTQEASANQIPTLHVNDPAMDSTTTSLPATPTQIPLTTMSYSPSADPIVGTWVCRVYLASGPLKKEYTFMENGGWTRINTNLQSLVQSTQKGTWRNEGDDKYALLGSRGVLATFAYDSMEDVLYDPNFKETFHRVPEENIPSAGLPPLNLTVWSAQKVPKINGSRPHSGYAYVLLNISIENIDDPKGFSFADKNIRITYDDGPGSWSMNTKLEGRVENAFPLGVIAPNETRQGNVAVSVPDNTHSCVVKIVNNEGDIVSNVVELGNI